MAIKIRRRLPEVKTLYEILPTGSEGGKEFARIVDLLLFHESKNAAKSITLFNDTSGDYHGLDSFERGTIRLEGTIGYQYKFFPSPLSAAHRKEIELALKKAIQGQEKLDMKKWIIITPQDFIESSTRKDGGDVTWFESLQDELEPNFAIEHWGHKQLQALFLNTPFLCLFYYPELVTDGALHKTTVEGTRKKYDDNLPTLHSTIKFVGMSIRENEAVRGVPIEQIYIPLKVIAAALDEEDVAVTYFDPVKLLSPGTKSIILGDPGSGKSTLLHFLALVGTSLPLQKRCNALPDKRLPVFITLRRYADELKSRPNLALIDYIQEDVQADFSLKNADFTFFSYYLESGQAILFFDGLDELPTSHFKEIIKNRINTLITTYPGNTCIVTSRIVGYDNPFRFEEKLFVHFRVAQLKLPEIEQFVNDWYRIRIDNERDRNANAKALVDIINDPDNVAIRELAKNPLLLTIIALVHRLDAALPDQRVVLYQKCTETLLKTWHTQKYRETEAKNKGKADRRNKRRIEAIAYWMHERGGGIGGSERAVVPYQELKSFLVKHISDTEESQDPDNDPEDVADEFLLFIKKQAGLMSELGDKQYSFIHLTFQEYLASSHIIVEGQNEGVSGTWEIIRPYCNDPRWHEVIRLTLAGLENNKSQKFLIEHLLDEAKKDQQHIILSRLLGGVLLDGIDAAEVHEAYKGRIVNDLLASCSKAAELEEMKLVLSPLRALVQKKAIGTEGIYEEVANLNLTLSQENKISLALVTLCIGLPLGNFIDLNKEGLTDDTRDAALLKLFFTDAYGMPIPPALETDMRRFWFIKNGLSLVTEVGNLIAVMGQAVTSFFDDETSLKRVLQEEIVVMNIHYKGPFIDFLPNVLKIAFGDSVPQELREVINSIITPVKKGPKKVDNLTAEADNPQSSELTEFLKDIGQYLLNTRKYHFYDEELEFNREAEEILTLFYEDEVILLRDSEKIERNRRRIKKGFMRLPRNSQNYWQSITSSVLLTNAFLDVLCIIFKLNPRPQWWEALRLNFLPRVPERIKRTYQDLCKPLHSILQEENIGVLDAYAISWHIILDVWRYMMHHEDTLDEKILNKVEKLTQNTDIAAIHIAYVIYAISRKNSNIIEKHVERLFSSNSVHTILNEGIQSPTLPKYAARMDEFQRSVENQIE